jgi:hypothetical protein
VKVRVSEGYDQEVKRVEEVVESVRREEGL